MDRFRNITIRFAKTQHYLQFVVKRSTQSEFLDVTKYGRGSKH